MKTMVKDLCQGQQICSDFLLKDVKTGISKRNTNYIRCNLADKTGSVVAVWWDWDGVEIPSGIVHVIGQISEYQGAPQIVIERVLPRKSTSDEDFEKISQYPVDQMWGRILATIDGIENHHIRSIAADLMLTQGYEHAFKRCPAASGMHHAFVAGLLEHTTQMLEMADNLFRLPFISSALNKDLCMFGLMFHDFGKIFEYEHSGGFKYTIQGMLVPHIPMTGAMIYETANRYSAPEIIRDHLMHVVLAHHGRMEYGSPVNMAIPEAAFVHYIDNLHGDVYGWIQKIGDAKDETVKHASRNLLVRRFSDIIQEIEDRERGEMA